MPPVLRERHKDARKNKSKGKTKAKSKGKTKTKTKTKSKKVRVKEEDEVKVKEEDSSSTHPYSGQDGPDRKVPAQAPALVPEPIVDRTAPESSSGDMRVPEPAPAHASLPRNRLPLVPINDDEPALEFLSGSKGKLSRTSGVISDITGITLEQLRAVWNRACSNGSRMQITGQHRCFELCGATNRPGGYMQLYVNRRKQMAHVVAYMLWYRKYYLDQRVYHLCDNNVCINPAHLVQGSEGKYISHNRHGWRLDNGQQHASDGMALQLPVFEEGAMLYNPMHGLT
ncbi:hypothetical protein DL89DRAFT_281130 [Linderina pennispora]|uniref:Zinc-binding loop region of homing endonuclease domain-containing protein n=1 Tax=Linderina pennispora TaxID=61395 RepID=A0A1Y1WMN7_9FUNG|nr:uncharacterized protein DL89DRAFT_281130 [Linderina pennispora]ORX74801.1 hypothetical protein DL89DRAFT_281130 [Linderina pennispora]